MGKRIRSVGRLAVIQLIILIAMVISGAASAVVLASSQPAGSGLAFCGGQCFGHPDICSRTGGASCACNDGVKCSNLP